VHGSTTLSVFQIPFHRSISALTLERCLRHANDLVVLPSCKRSILPDFDRKSTGFPLYNVMPGLPCREQSWSVCAAYAPLSLDALQRPAGVVPSLPRHPFLLPSRVGSTPVILSLSEAVADYGSFRISFLRWWRSCTKRLSYCYAIHTSG